ncbi:MAG: GNAT family N-acetyltransferase [Turicibacter sp.]
MNFKEMTKRYYAKWLGTDLSVLNEKGVFFVESSEREKPQLGYSQTFKIYAYVNEELIIISYSKEIINEIENLKSKIKIGIGVQELSNILENAFNVNVFREIKFYFGNPVNEFKSDGVVKLIEKDYENYLTFFKTQHPNANPDGWLQEYFQDICVNEFCFGIFKDGKLVSVSDGPDMPYMNEEVQEIGINTLSEYRGSGYGKLVANECIKSIISNNKCPLWSCPVTNTASEKLAYSLGFKKLGDVLTVSL